eukprot:364556-Chlamydomonas_euryale.AAC.25
MDYLPKPGLAGQACPASPTSQHVPLTLHDRTHHLRCYCHAGSMNPQVHKQACAQKISSYLPI